MEGENLRTVYIAGGAFVLGAIGTYLMFYQDIATKKNAGEFNKRESMKYTFAILAGGIATSVIFTSIGTVLFDSLPPASKLFPDLIPSPTDIPTEVPTLTPESFPPSGDPLPSATPLPQDCPFGPDNCLNA